MEEYKEAATSIKDLEAKLLESEATVVMMRKALSFYANEDKETWTSYVEDSYSGRCWSFDWPADLGEKPWDIAKKALQSHR